MAGAIVRRAALVRFPNLDLENAYAFVVDFRRQAVSYHARDIFSGGLHVVERRNLVQKNVLVRLDERTQLFSEQREIHDESRAIERIRPKRRFDFPVVTMKALAFTARDAELVRGSNIGLVADLPHAA